MGTLSLLLSGKKSINSLNLHQPANNVTIISNALCQSIDIIFESFMGYSRLFCVRPSSAQLLIRYGFIGHLLCTVDE